MRIWGTLQVLEMLIAEDDTVPEVWYLLGLALHAGGEFEDALTAAAEAERLVSQRRHEDPDAGETLLDIEDLKVRMLVRLTATYVGPSAPEECLTFAYCKWMRRARVL